jgi:hypothetical protein
MYDLNEDDGRNLNTVLARAVVDAEFRTTLLADPHAAVRQATGVALPKDLKIRFVEQPKDVDALIVLPNIVAQQDELTPEELEAVSGGLEESAEFICWDTCTTTCGKSCSNTCAVTEITPV